MTLERVFRFVRYLLVVSVLVAPLVLAVVGWQFDTRGSVCAPDLTHEKVEAKVTQPVTLSLRGGQRTTVTFGRDSNTKRLTVPLEMVDGEMVERINPLFIVVDEFHRDGEDDGAQLNPNKVHITAKPSGKFVRVRVCVERSDQGSSRQAAPTDSPSPDASDIIGGRPTEGAEEEGSSDIPPPHPGTYQGAVTIVDRRVETFTLPITIKLAYPVWPHIALWLYLAIVVGSFYVWTLKRESLDDIVFSAPAISDFGRWLATLNGVIAVAGGTAGALAVFAATYLESPDWGADWAQHLSLFGAMFTAFVTAGSALAKKEQARRNPTDGTSLPQDGGVSLGPTEEGVSLGPQDGGVSLGPTEEGVSLGPTEEGVSLGPLDAVTKPRPGKHKI